MLRQYFTLKYVLFVGISRKRGEFSLSHMNQGHQHQYLQLKYIILKEKYCDVRNTFCYLTGPGESVKERSVTLLSNRWLSGEIILKPYQAPSRGLWMRRPGSLWHKNKRAGTSNTLSLGSRVLHSRWWTTFLLPYKPFKNVCSCHVYSIWSSLVFRFFNSVVQK